MAFPAFDKGYFQVTALSFSPAIVAVGETAALSVTIKNVSGKNITKCYVDLGGRYPSTDESSSGSFPTQFLYGGGGSSGYDMKAISWANNASRTFTTTVSFAEGYYPLDQTDYVLDPADTYIRIGVTTNVFFPDETNSDNLYIRPNGDYLSILSRRDRPRLTLDIERTPNDEATAVKTTARLTSSSTAAALAAHGYGIKLYATNAHSPARPTDTQVAFNVTLQELIGGITDSTGAITTAFSNGTDWYFLLRVSNGYETTSAYESVPRAFANIHLAGATTGGVAFGKFSSAREGSPLFECAYPAVFEAGISDFGGAIQAGRTAGTRVEPGATGDVAVTFARAFAAAPAVLVGFETGSTAGAFGRCCCAVLEDSITKTGFTVRIFNGDSTARTPRVRWLAVGI